MSITPAPDGGQSAQPDEPTLPTGERVQEVAGEAAKYRKRAQSAEAERDQLRNRLDHAHRGEVERLATGIERPADLWEVLGLTIEQCRNEDGDLDTEAVQALLETARTDRPYLFKKRTPVDLGQGDRERLNDGASWAQALNPR